MISPKQWHKANTLFNKRRFSDVHKLLARYCNHPDCDAEALFLFGSSCRQLDDPQKGITVLEKVIAIQPRHVRALIELARCAKQLGDRTAEEFHLRKAIPLQAGAVEPYIQLSQCLKAQNKPREAGQILQHAIKLKPDCHEAFHELGILAQSQGQFREAVIAFKKALNIKPRLPESHKNLAECLLNQGHLDKALLHYEETLKHKKKDIETYTKFGEALSLTGNLDKAMEIFDKALHLNKENPDAAVGKAGVLTRQHKYREAFDILKPLIDQGLVHPGIAHLLTKCCPSLGNCDLARDYLERVINNPSVTDHHRALVCFGLGKLYDADQQYDKAFSYFSRANQLMPLSYDAANHAKATDALIEVCNRQGLAALPRAGHDTRRPIFIVGMPRSGTTLVEQILASHPSVYGAGELKTLGDIVSSIEQKTGCREHYPQCVKDLNQDLVDELSKEYLDCLCSLDADSPHISDKMPHNFVHLGLVELLFPQARIVHCRRNPLDTCLSIYFQKFNASHNYANDLNDLGLHYRQYQTLMDHWKQTLTTPIMDIDYELIVEDTEQASRALIEFCGLKWDERCLQFYASRRFVNTASDEQVNKPIYHKSVQRWKNYEHHIEPLIQILGEPR